MKKLAVSLVIAYLIGAGIFFAIIFPVAPIQGKLVLSAVFVLKYKYLMGWVLMTIAAIRSVDILKEKYPDSFKT